MSQSETIARPYAKAAYAIAKETDNIADWSSFLNVAGNICANEDVMMRLSAPEFTQDLKSWIDQYLKEVRKEGLRDKEKSFLNILETANRLDVLPEVANEYQAQLLADQGICHATVYTAKSLTKEQQKSVQKAIAEKTGQKVTLDVFEKPELLAGVRIEYNGLVIDQSAQGRIAQFASQLEESRN